MSRVNGMSAEQILDADRQLWKHTALRAQARVEQGESFLAASMAKTIAMSVSLDAADGLLVRVRELLDCEDGYENWMEIRNAANLYDLARKVTRS